MASDGLSDDMVVPVSSNWLCMSSSFAPHADCEIVTQPVAERGSNAKSSKSARANNRSLVESAIAVRNKVFIAGATFYARERVYTSHQL